MRAGVAHGGGAVGRGGGGGVDGVVVAVVSICVFTAVLCLCLVAGHLLKENKWVNESITTLIIGCIVGALIFLLSKGRNSHILRFDEQHFFIYVLPPIIFNAGFQVKKKQFFHNFLTIMSFGVFGVFISVAIVSACTTSLLILRFFLHALLEHVYSTHFKRNTYRFARLNKLLN